MGSDGNRQLTEPAEPMAAVSAYRFRTKAVRAAIVTATAIGALTVLCIPVKLCAFALCTHIPCPGCGMTRALLAMVHGDFAHSWALHPLALVIAPWTASVVGRHGLDYVRTGRLTQSTGSRPRDTVVASIALTLLLAVWVARFFGFFGGPVAV